MPSPENITTIPFAKWLEEAKERYSGGNSPKLLIYVPDKSDRTPNEPEYVLHLQKARFNFDLLPTSVIEDIQGSRIRLRAGYVVRITDVLHAGFLEEVVLFENMSGPRMICHSVNCLDSQ